MIVNEEFVTNQVKAEIFWGEIAPCDHVLQIYENDEAFLSTLTGFVGAGINSGDSVIVIATHQHLQQLRKRLVSHALHLDLLIADNRCILLDAKEVLSQFIVNGWPDEERFGRVVKEIFDKARQRNRRVRAFGEMVAVLWAQGNAGATIQLEHLWNRFREKTPFSLFCAYPSAGFTNDLGNGIKDICKCHSLQVEGIKSSVTEVVYYR